MPDERVELAQKMLSAFEERDIEGFVALCDPEVEANALVSAFEGTYEGHDGIRRWIGDLWRLAPEYWVTADVIRPFGDDAVLVLGRQGGVAAISGTPFELPFAIVARLRNGLLVQSQAYSTHAEALEAAGVPPDREQGPG